MFKSASFMIFAVPLILTRIIQIQANFSIRKCPDYYWRDYDGEIPADAVLGGRDAEGGPIYIGQVYIKDYELLPATIHPSLKIATTSAHVYVLHEGKNIKILCSPYYNEAFVWLSIKSEQLKSVQSNNFLIPGGSEVGENLFISRNRRDNGDIIGKIFRDDRSNRGAWFPYKNTPINELIYEVLMFDCNRIPRLTGTD